MKQRYRISMLFLLQLTMIPLLSAQLRPDFANESLWFHTKANRVQIEQEVITIDAENVSEGAMTVLKDLEMTTGSVELDILGANKPGRNFVGLAFNIQSESIYEAVYFRPFNFQNQDRKTHACQYIFEPVYSWRHLRTHFPEKYESEIDPPPNPDDWFHVRITFDRKWIRAYVDQEKNPSLTVERIALTHKGGVGLWVGSNTKASFRNLTIDTTWSTNYGYNEGHGNYFEVEPGTRLYYEEYGEGEPLLMLHGGVYGYIDEYQPFIDQLSLDHRVICLATRGHVKSDIGQEPLSFDQRAMDARKLLDHLGITSAKVVGFSDGGLSAFRLAAMNPAMVSKMVVIGAGDRPLDSRGEANYNAKDLLANNAAYFKPRIAAMPEPDRWDESLQMLNDLYNNHGVSKETFEEIDCPVLLLSGDQDGFASPSHLLSAKSHLKDASLALIPKCGHVVFYCNWDAVWACVKPFISD